MINCFFMVRLPEIPRCSDWLRSPRRHLRDEWILWISSVLYFFRAL
jgi:hypothetical protein